MKTPDEYARLTLADLYVCAGNAGHNLKSACVTQANARERLEVATKAVELYAEEFAAVTAALRLAMGKQAAPGAAEGAAL